MVCFSLSAYNQFCDLKENKIITYKYFSFHKMFMRWSIMSEMTKSNCKNFFKTNDEVKRKISFNQKWVEIINLCEKGTKEKNK